MMVERDHALALKRQCEILQLSRSSQYYGPVPTPERDLILMRRIDALHLEHPFFGSRRLRDTLHEEGFEVGRRHVRTLMDKMGIEALYCKPRLSDPAPGHKLWPYLLRNLRIDRPNQVWAADITYIPLAKGFAYLVAIIDWHSRKVLAWRLSNCMDTSFCLDALEEALMTYGKPEIFNTDQGSQFTSEEFTGKLLEHGIAISMDGRGRWIDNVFVERLWRSVKYEAVYLKAYESIPEAKADLRRYFEFFNQRRRHQGIGERTPDTVYYAGRELPLAA
jgi:putative transposase